MNYYMKRRRTVGVTVHFRGRAQSSCGSADELKSGMVYELGARRTAPAGVLTQLCSIMDRAFCARVAACKVRHQ